jgi:chromosome segregation ATPase
MTQPEVSMTPEECLAVLDKSVVRLHGMQLEHAADELSQARAAVAELVKERDEFRKDRDECKEYCARVSEGKEAADNERDALRRRVGELERAVKRKNEIIDRCQLPLQRHGYHEAWKVCAQAIKYDGKEPT